MNLFVLATAMMATAPVAHRQIALPSNERTIFVGWNDEMDYRLRWSPLNMENRAFTATPTPGTLFLGLDHVPANWPYEYQWSGVSQDVGVNVAKFPILMARVSQVQGYAHLDIDVLGSKGQVLMTLRTSTLNAPGLSTLDLSHTFFPDNYHLRLRLIVGGTNDGCSATYNWVRFVSKSDSDFLQSHPDWRNVRRNGIMLR